MTTGGKWGIGIGTTLLVAAIAYFVFFKKNKPEVKAYNEDPAKSDDYTIELGTAKTHYSKGDASKTFSLDKTWSAKIETLQDHTNRIQVSVIKNGKVDSTRIFV